MRRWRCATSLNLLENACNWASFNELNGELFKQLLPPQSFHLACNDSATAAVCSRISLKHSRSCAVLVDDVEGLRFVRAGEHVLVFLDRPNEVIIVDILHSRGDLPRHVAALTVLKNDGS